MDTATTPVVPQFQLRHRLLLALEEAGLTKAEMADVLGCVEATVRNYTTGRTNPSKAVLRLWAMRCGVPFEWLANGTVDLTDGPDGPGTRDVSPTKWYGDAGTVAPVIEFRRAA